MDCCHSGGILDLPYLFTGTEDNLKKALAGEAVQMVISRNWIADMSAWHDGNPAALLQDAAGLGLQLWDLYGKYKNSQGANDAGFRTEESGNVGLAVGEVIAITGCRSDQTSADVGNVSGHFDLQPTARTGAGGALTCAFIEAVERTLGAQAPSYFELLEGIRQKLSKEGFSQVPQLASSLLVDLNCPFSVDTICLPAQAGADGAKSMGGGSGGVGGGGGGGGAAAGFMNALAAAPVGLQMLQAAGGGGGGANASRGMGEGGGPPGVDPNLVGAVSSLGGMLGGFMGGFGGFGGRDAPPQQREAPPQQREAPPPTYDEASEEPESSYLGPPPEEYEPSYLGPPPEEYEPSYVVPPPEEYEPSYVGPPPDEYEQPPEEYEPPAYEDEPPPEEDFVEEEFADDEPPPDGDFGAEED